MMMMMAMPRPPAPVGPGGGAAPAPPPAAATAGAADGGDDDPELAALEAQAAAIEAEAAALDAEERRRRVEAAWTAHRAPDGRTFYHNGESGESSWVKPATFQGEADVGALPTPVAQVEVGDTSWVRVMCADGRQYFFDKRTRQASWAVPPEVAAFQRRAEEQAAEVRCFWFFYVLFFYFCCVFSFFCLHTRQMIIPTPAKNTLPQQQ
jgi:hypothetical protein